MEAKDRTSVLLSIFRRKGGEGIYTKLINENNSAQYEFLLSGLEEGEKGLIIYFRDKSDWLLLTNKRTMATMSGSYLTILNSDLGEVHLALEDEFRDGVMDKNNFSRLRVKDKKNRNYILKLEMGKPFQGLYQVLHFLAG